MFKSNWLLWIFILYLAITVTSSSNHDNCEKTTKTIQKPTKSLKKTPSTFISCPSCQESACDHQCNDTPCRHQCKDGPCNKSCIYKFPPPIYDPQIVAVGTLLMTIGAFFMAMGFPIFIVTMALTGLLIGSSVTWVCLRTAEPLTGFSSTTYLATSIGIGVLFAIASLFWWKITVYLLCAASGYLISIFIWTWKEDFIFRDILARNIIGLALSFVFILGFVLIEFATIIISTSFIGAYIFILGLDLFIKTGFFIGFKNLLDFNIKDNIDTSITDHFYAYYTISTKVSIMLFSVLGLFIISTFWQRYFNKGRRFGLRVVINSNDTLKARFEDSQRKKIKK